MFREIALLTSPPFIQEENPTSTTSLILLFDQSNSIPIGSCSSHAMVTGKLELGSREVGWWGGWEAGRLGGWVQGAE